ncbi:hypothetical protein [Mobilicoccus massiliensis]|uniref:hypothetical protein n=1 Tax=Mobilicoccus massiliensis TaxID=1522310 RepID=UPI00058CABDF|nr:hypothetical protein [Mobilicoccus massiliensis]
MRAAVRLWWLLRSTSEHPRDLAIAASFGLMTWALLAAGGLIALAAQQERLDGTLVGAVVAIVAALVLTAVLASRSLLRRTESRRLAVLRTTGASRAQTTVIGALDVADSAVPGVVAGVAADALLVWLLRFTGADLTPTMPVALLPSAILALAAGVIVVRRVRVASRSCADARPQEAGVGTGRA